MATRFREVRYPWTSQPQESARVRSELNPIGGIQPGGFGFSDTAGLPLTFNGAYVSEALNEQGRALSFLDNNSTGLTRSVSVSTWPLTFVFSGNVSGSTFRVLSSLATTGDKTVRVYGLDGIVRLQRIGNTTFANIDANVWQYGKPFTCVCVVRSDSDASVYALGSVGYAEAHSTANVGTMPTLNKLAFGKYSGGVDLYPQYGQTNIAQWLAIDPTRQQIDEWLRNPWQIFAPQSIWVPVSAGGGGSTVTLTGTVTTATESDIVAGGKTIILTLTGDTWVASGATFNAIRQNIIDGIDSDLSESGGWDAQVKANQGVSGVVRTSDTVVTITLDAQASYNITATETITATIPASAVSLAAPIVASPAFTVTPVSAAMLFRTRSTYGFRAGSRQAA